VRASPHSKERRAQICEEARENQGLRYNAA